MYFLSSPKPLDVAASNFACQSIGDMVYRILGSICVTLTPRWWVKKRVFAMVYSSCVVFSSTSILIMFANYAMLLPKGTSTNTQTLMRCKGMRLHRSLLLNKDDTLINP